MTALKFGWRVWLIELGGIKATVVVLKGQILRCKAQFFKFKMTKQKQIKPHLC